MTSVPSEQEETLAMVEQAVREFAQPDSARVRTVRDTMEGCDRDRWREMAGLGWLTVLLPEEQGGAGVGLAGAAKVARWFGYACVTEPFVAQSVTALQALAASPQGACRDDLMRRLGDGSAFVALAFQPEMGSIDPSDTMVTASGGADGATLDGQVRFVVPHLADTILVVAQTADGHSLCAVDKNAPGLDVKLEKQADGTRAARLALSGVTVTPDRILMSGDDTAPALVRAIEAGIIATAAELTGLVERMMDVTKAYLGERSQFGKAIGSFQVLQHRMVDMWMQMELSKAALGTALAAFDAPDTELDELRKLASSAKARASHAASFIAGQSVQLHGAIGFTDEYELGVYVNRALTLAATSGNAAAHRRRFGRLATIGEK